MGSHCSGDEPDGVRGRLSLRLDGARIAQRKIDTLLHSRLRCEDNGGFLALGQVDLRLLLALGVEDERAPSPLSFRLHLHGGAHSGRRRNVTDLVAHALDAPRDRRCVDRLDDACIELIALQKSCVQRELANLRPHRRLCELRDRKVRVFDAVRGRVCIDYAHVQHAVDADAHVIACDRGLRRHH